MITDFKIIEFDEDKFVLKYKDYFLNSIIHAIDNEDKKYIFKKSFKNAMQTSTDSGFNYLHYIATEITEVDIELR